MHGGIEDEYTREQWNFLFPTTNAPTFLLMDVTIQVCFSILDRNNKDRAREGRCAFKGVDGSAGPFHRR